MSPLRVFSTCFGAIHYAQLRLEGGGLLRSLPFPRTNLHTRALARNTPRLPWPFQSHMASHVCLPPPPLDAVSMMCHPSCQLAALDLEPPAEPTGATPPPHTGAGVVEDEVSPGAGAGAGAAAGDGPAIHPSAAPASPTGETASFVPTRQWLYEWKAQLKLGTLLRLIQVGLCFWGTWAGAGVPCWS